MAKEETTLVEAKIRFNEIFCSGFAVCACLSDIKPMPATHKVLTETLRELEQMGFINRTDFDENPPRVEYSLKEAGKTKLPILTELQRWGMRYKAEEK